MFFLFPTTLWLFNVAIGNGPFIDGLPIKNGDFPWLCNKYPDGTLHNIT
jgi:hypothetical protein